MITFILLSIPAESNKWPDFGNNLIAATLLWPDLQNTVHMYLSIIDNWYMNERGLPCVCQSLWSVAFVGWIFCSQVNIKILGNMQVWSAKVVIGIVNCMCVCVCVCVHVCVCVCVQMCECVSIQTTIILHSVVHSLCSNEVSSMVSSFSTFFFFCLSLIIFSRRALCSSLGLATFNWSTYPRQGPMYPSTSPGSPFSSRLRFSPVRTVFSSNTVAAPSSLALSCSPTNLQLLCKAKAQYLNVYKYFMQKKF